MPKYRVLKPLPQGQRPGETVDLHEDVARVFLLVEAVEPVPDPADKTAKGYSRRDQVAAGAKA